MDISLMHRLLDRGLPDSSGVVQQPKMLHLYGGRGSGKTWWIDRVEEMARSTGHKPIRIASRSIGLRRMADELENIRGHDAVLVDDDDYLDSDALKAIVLMAPAVLVTTGSTIRPEHLGFAARIEPMQESDLAKVLRERGLAPEAAANCAAAASGNPGLAIAIAGGLTDEQWRGLVPVPPLPRLAASVATELHASMRALGESSSRALMVAAADDDGNLRAIRHALALLGEPADFALDAAEAAGILEVVAYRVAFRSQWDRLAAYYLLAGPSRRAAHSALASAYATPRDAVSRVRHLIAASAAPDDAIARTALASAAALGSQGKTIEACDLATRAAELSDSSEIRSLALLRATQWALHDGRYRAALGLVEQMDLSQAEEHAARAEVDALLLGDLTLPNEPKLPAGGWDEANFATRTANRRVWWHAGAGGVVAMLGSIPTFVPPAELVARAELLRHRGLLTDAAELIERTLTVLPDGPSAVRSRWAAARVDVSFLLGRSVGGPPGDERPVEEVRRRLAADASLVWSPDAILPGTIDPIAGIRARMRSAIVSRDRAALLEVAAVADAAGLPVESAEALVISLDLAAADGVEPDATLLGRTLAQLHGSGVTVWDARLAAISRRFGRGTEKPGTTTRHSSTALLGLSSAEQRVAEEVALGKTNRQVAAELFIALKTVDFHLQQIYRKLSIRSRTELAVRVTGAHVAATLLEERPVARSDQ
jgi:DNA-binding NarL/FixJ family response regulator